MEKAIVAVGSTRGPKLGAAQEVLKAIGAALDPLAEFEVIGVEVPSGVGHTPASREETMSGARARAKALAEIARANGEPWRYFVGLEGGLAVVREEGKRLVFLENWAYVLGRDGHDAYGSSGGVLLPDALAEEVLDRGVELSAAIDKFTGGEGIRNAQGVWGVMTRNLITRQDAFRFALINAFAPFMNARMYSSTRSA
jgi:inosine/xanthosine triphosphatase